MARTSFARRTQRTIVGAAKSGAASVQKTVLKAATAAATAAAQAAVESVIHSMEARESQTRRNPRRKGGLQEAEGRRAGSAKRKDAKTKASKSERRLPR
jgi:hypothetical protein